MILYHGTNEDIKAIDLTRGMRHKDFGKGFYLTPDRNTAIRMAQKKARLFGGSATLITYEMDDAALKSDLKVQIFPEQAAHNYRTNTLINSISSEQNMLCAFFIKQTLK